MNHSTAPDPASDADTSAVAHANPVVKRFNWMALLPLLLLIPLGFLLHSGLGKDTHVVPSPYLGKELPKIVGPDLFTQAPIDLSQYRGQPIILNVWASWCVACVDEHPVYNQYKTTEGAIKVIGLAYRDQPDNAKAWLAQLGNPFDAVILDEDGRIGIDLGVTGAPETFFVDAQGRVRYKHISPVSMQLIEQKVAELRK